MQRSDFVFLFFHFCKAVVVQWYQDDQKTLLDEMQFIMAHKAHHTKYYQNILNLLWMCLFNDLTNLGFYTQHDYIYIYIIISLYVYTNNIDIGAVMHKSNKWTTKISIFCEIQANVFV